MSVHFKDAAITADKNGSVICYRSSLAVMEEQLYHGVPVSAGYNTAGYPLNVLGNYPTRLDPRRFAEPFSFNIEADGESVCRQMALSAFNKNEEDGALHTEAVFRSGVKPLTVTEHTVLDGTNMFTRYLEIENKSSSPVSLSRLVLHGGGIECRDLNDVSWLERPDIKSIYSYACFDNDEWGREGELGLHPLSPGTVCVDATFGAGRFRHPALFLFNNMTGDTYFVQVGWSAGVRFTVNYDAKSQSGTAALSYSAEITGHRPLYVLAPGEKLVTPELHFCAVHGGLDRAVNENIAHLRRSVLNCREADPDALYVGAGMGAEHDMSVETSIEFAAQMKKMGAEVFIIDAGWACPPGKENEWYKYNGINRADKDRYCAGGLKKIRDFCHENGMKFAMWMEPERFGEMAGVAAGHPDWMAKNIYGEICGGFIDMTNPDAARWVESEIARIVTDYELDLLRIDYNVSGIEAFAFKDNRGREECAALRHFNAVYAMYSRLKKRFPSVVFENCAGGGGRTDVGMMKSFNHTWVSDNQKMPRSVGITNGMTMVLPPERVDRLFAGMECHTRGELYAHIRNTMLTHMSLNVIAPVGLQPDAVAMDYVAHSVDFYKRYIRPMLPHSLVFHRTPTAADAGELGFYELEIAAPDGEIGFIGVFTLPFSGRKSAVLFPEGIDRSAGYKVYFDNSRAEYEMSGGEIADRGIRINIDGALSSELIMYRKK